ncbi:MAG: hypothetical protein ACP5C4_02475 [Methanomicrobiales archaeon]
MRLTVIASPGDAEVEERVRATPLEDSNSLREIVSPAETTGIRNMTNIRRRKDTFWWNSAVIDL